MLCFLVIYPDLTVLFFGGGGDFLNLGLHSHFDGEQVYLTLQVTIFNHKEFYSKQ